MYQQSPFFGFTPGSFIVIKPSPFHFSVDLMAFLTIRRCKVKYVEIMCNCTLCILDYYSVCTVYMFMVLFLLCYNNCSCCCYNNSSSSFFQSAAAPIRTTSHHCAKRYTLYVSFSNITFCLTILLCARRL